MEVRCCAGIPLALFAVLAIGCGGGASDPDPARSAGAATAGDAADLPLAKAESTLAAPPPLEGTFASSLAGVARWEVHGTAGSLDALVEGKDAHDKPVVTLSFAYAKAPASGAAVVYAADRELAFPFEAVRAAVQHDVAAGGAVAPQDLVSGHQIVCGGSFGVALLGAACTVVGCGIAIGSVGTVVLADVACYGCFGATAAAVGGGAAAGCQQGDLPAPSGSDAPTT